MKMKTCSLIGFIIFITLLPISSYSKGYSYKTISDFLDKVLTPDLPKNPEEDMTLAEIIRYHGYPVEEYTIITQDGYIINIERIPYGKKNTTASLRRDPVLLLPGLFAVSAIYFSNSPENNLPYLLAENGYDVWLGNFRGTTFGRRHVTLTPKHKKFWNFSLDEMILYDIPNTIDFVLNTTDFEYLHIIGHSMGNTNLFATLASIPKYNEKVRSFHALGPSVKLDHMSSPILRFGIAWLDVLTRIQDIVGSFELLRYKYLNEFIMHMAIKWFPSVFYSMLAFAMEDFDAKQFNRQRMPVVVHFYPSGTSLKTAIHYFQIARQGRFQHYDYGEKGNKEIYNQTIPPLYDITKVTCPVALYWAEKDRIAPSEDVAFLIENLSNLVLSYRIPYKKFNHEDFMYALDVVPLLYEKLIETINNLSRKNYQ